MRICECLAIFWKVRASDDMQPNAMRFFELLDMIYFCYYECLY
jgi:hypothetical protein